MGFDSLELRLASAVQRYHALQRRADTHRDPGTLLGKTLAELGTALESLRIAQDQLIDSRRRIDQLQAELKHQLEKYSELFDEMPEACVVTRPDSTMIEVNKAVALLFNVSQRFLIGKALSVFVCEDRTQFLAACAQAVAEETPRELIVKLRPRERAPIAATLRVSRGPDGLRWILRV